MCDEAEAKTETGWDSDLRPSECEVVATHPVTRLSMCVACVPRINYIVNGLGVGRATGPCTSMLMLRERCNVM